MPTHFQLSGFSFFRQSNQRQLKGLKTSRHPLNISFQASTAGKTWSYLQLSFVKMHLS